MTKEQELQMEKYYQELLKDGIIKTLNEALVFKLSYEKAFLLNGVSRSIGSDTKPIIKTITEEEKKETDVCGLCIDIRPF